MYKMDNRNYDLRVNAVYEVPEIQPSGGVLRPSRLKAMLLYLIVGAGLLVSSGIGAALNVAFPDMGFWTMQAIITIFYYGCACLLPVLLFVRKGGRERAMSMRPNPVRFRTALVAVALGVISLFFANNLNVLWALPFDAAGLNIYVATVPAPENIGQLLLAGENHVLLSFVVGGKHRRHHAHQNGHGGNHAQGRTQQFDDVFLAHKWIPFSVKSMDFPISCIWCTCM